MTQHSQNVAGVEVRHDSANSHCFDDRIMVAGECVAFASEPWSSKIAASLTAREPATADVGREAREALERIEAWASSTYPQLPLNFRRTNEGALVCMAHDFADIRAELNAAPSIEPEWVMPTPAEERAKLIAAYAGPVVSFDVAEPFYLASCDACGWVGSSGACSSDEADDVFCPRCFASGADCGKVAERIPAPSSGHAMAEGEREDEATRLRHKLWMVACHATGGGIPKIEGIDRSTNDICVQITASRNLIYQAGKEQGAKEAATTPPTTNDAIPAGEVERLAQFLHDEGGFGDAMTDRTWPEHPGDTGQRENGWVRIVPSDVQAHFRDAARRWLLPRTPKPSPTPKGGLPGRGEVEALVPAFKAWDAQHDDRVQPLLLAAADMRGASRWGCDDAEKVVAFLLSLAPAEAIRDGGEGGEG